MQTMTDAIDEVLADVECAERAKDTTTTTGTKALRRVLGAVAAAFEPVAALRDELANEKAAHAEAERLLSAERAALEVSRAKVLDLEMRAVEAERLLTEAREQRQQSLTAASRAAGEIIEARDRLSRVKAAVDALRDAVGTHGQRAAFDAVDRALAGVEAPSRMVPDREALGREVRRVWIAWAREQPSPKPSWLVPWEGLSEPDREVDRRIGERLWTMGAGVEARPALTEERARALWEEAIREGAKTMRPVDDITVDALLRVARGDFGEAPREPATEQPRTDLAALADAIEANGRTWQRVEPSTLARALRAVDRRMGTLEAAVTALAASVEQVQTKAGIGEPRVVDVEGGVNGPMRVRRPDPQDEGEAGDDCPPSCTNPDPNHRHPALRAKRLADEQRTRLHEGDPTAKVDRLIDHGVGIRPEHANLPRCPKCDVRHPLEWLCPDTTPPNERQDTALLAAHRRVEAFTDPEERREGRRRLSVSWSSPRTAVERGGHVEGDEVVWPDGARFPISPENVTELAGGFAMLGKPGEFVSPQQGDGSGRLVLGTFNGQPIRARYTGVTPTEPRKP